MEAAETLDAARTQVIDAFMVIERLNISRAKSLALDIPGSSGSVLSTLMGHRWRQLRCSLT